MIKHKLFRLTLFVIFVLAFHSSEASIFSTEIKSCEQNIIVSGKVVDINGDPIENAEVCINANLTEYPRCRSTDENGYYSFGSIPAGNQYELSVSKGVKQTKYLSTLDFVLIVKHMLGLKEHLDHPYKIIAADTNADNKLTSLDLESFRYVIWGVLPKFPNNEIIRYVNADYDFPDEKNPWPDENGNPFIIKFKPSEDVSFGFVGIRVGNVSQNTN